MSERREHKRRYNLQLEYIARFSNWLNNEPPMILFWRWRKWKKERPIWDDSAKPYDILTSCERKEGTDNG